MKKILIYLKTHLKEDFNAGFYLFVTIFLTISFWINYTSGLKKILNDESGNEAELLFYYFLFYALPYYTTSLAYALFYKKSAFLKSPAYWGVSLFLLVVLTLNRNALSISTEFVRAMEVDEHVFHFVRLCVLNLVRPVLMILPVAVFWWLFDRSRQPFYGMTREGFAYGPYLVMILIMLPLIILASFQPSFLKTYPRYKPGSAELYWQVPHVATMLVFQMAYAMRFVSVELFFRGFAIMAMPREMGRAVVMPMVALYAFWHFGKPLGEAVGSIFGSFILGVIALESRTILGGILVHIGVAILMEWAAYVQLYVLR
jgi:hypothetical protein